MSAEPTPRDAPPAEGSTIACQASADDPRVYLIDEGQRRWVSSPAIFEALGFRWDEIRRLSLSEIQRLPEGPPIEDLINEQRYRLSRPFVSGRGLEVGAGIRPQRVPRDVVRECFDKRDREQLATYFAVDADKVPAVYPHEQVAERFPGGADFFIAHHVLEHSADPIGTLIHWNSLIRDGGTMVVSVPDSVYCPDRGRLIPPFEHVLFDHLLDRQADAFESREHIYSFLMGWCDVGLGAGVDKIELARKAHECAHAPENDLHWHAFDETLFVDVLLGAALLAGKRLVMRAHASPTRAAPPRTEGEILYVYTLHAQGEPDADQMARLKGHFAAAQVRLGKALARLTPVMLPVDSSSEVG